MRRLLVALTAVLPLAASAQDHAGHGPAGPTVTVSFAGGGELGLDHGKASVLELEGAVGYEFAGGIRPELALAYGTEPDDNFAFRPGVRVAVPGLPVQLRVAIDASTSRNATGLDWRWLLVGASGEIRLTSLFGFYAEIDTGAALASKAGVPLLVRVGSSFRF